MGTLIRKLADFGTRKTDIWSYRSPLWSGGLLGPYFFKHEDGTIITVNGNTNRNKINDLFVSV